MKKLILTVGISNSGKTTWAEVFAEENNYSNFNRDEFRASLYTNSNNIKDYKFTKARETNITNIVFNLAVKSDKVIISDTNLNPKTRAKWQEFAKMNNYEYSERVFNIETHIAQERNIKRDYSVPPHVINQQYRKFREYMNIKPYSANLELSPAVIFDLDGTLADMVGQRKPYDFMECGKDLPRWNVINMLLDNARDYTIILMSGRSDICREETFKWLSKHNIEFKHLHMRKEGDHRSDPIIKEELFNEFVKDKYNVKFVVDDRQRMVDHWRNMGLECWQVQSGDF